MEDSRLFSAQDFQHQREVSCRDPVPASYRICTRRAAGKVGDDAGWGLILQFILLWFFRSRKRKWAQRFELLTLAISVPDALGVIAVSFSKSAPTWVIALPGGSAEALLWNIYAEKSIVFHHQSFRKRHKYNFSSPAEGSTFWPQLDAALHSAYSIDTVNHSGTNYDNMTVCDRGRGVQAADCRAHCGKFSALQRAGLGPLQFSN